ncbi:uncharacterized protein MONOS_17571 [Monocercomonoides exilis]|uniref:uncharacterized protein n=1 Tax=Monocercomonoides exilis TaxID=2049356 RepID=UPI00355AA9E6|nr:hypothetical protein MONOS_17571 [Monocercomonoides exilis]
MSIFSNNVLHMDMKQTKDTLIRTQTMVEVERLSERYEWLGEVDCVCENKRGVVDIYQQAGNVEKCRAAVGLVEMELQFLVFSMKYENWNRRFGKKGGSRETGRDQRVEGECFGNKLSIELNSSLTSKSGQCRIVSQQA